MKLRALLVIAAGTAAVGTLYHLDPSPRGGDAPPPPIALESVNSPGVDAPKHDPLPGYPNEAARFRYSQRLSEDGTVPPNALMRAKADRDATIRAQERFGATSGVDWEWIGPGNVGGRIRAIVVEPEDPSTMFVGSASGGIWRTFNSGGRWEPLDDFMASLAVGCMIMDPFDSEVLYAGTGEGFFYTAAGASNTAAVRGAGIFKTEDGGDTWEQLESTAGRGVWWFVNRLAIPHLPEGNEILLAATHQGIMRSDDGGDTWENRWARRTGTRVFDVKFDPDSPGGLQVVAGGEDIALYSDDAGVNWQIAEGIPPDETIRVELAYSRNITPRVVYAAVVTPGCPQTECNTQCQAYGSDHIEVYRSEDGGRSYAQVSGDFRCIETYGPYCTAILVNPLEGKSDHIMVAGERGGG